MSDLIQHPAWCSLRLCNVTDPSLPLDGSEHRSEPVVLDLQRAMTNRGPLSRTGSGSAYLTQAACPWTTETYLHIEAAGEDMTLPLTQAAGVLIQLTHLIDQGTE